MRHLPSDAGCATCLYLTLQLQYARPHSADPPFLLPRFCLSNQVVILRLPRYGGSCYLSSVTARPVDERRLQRRRNDTLVSRAFLAWAAVLCIGQRQLFKCLNGGTPSLQPYYAPFTCPNYLVSLYNHRPRIVLTAYSASFHL